MIDLFVQNGSIANNTIKYGITVNGDINNKKSATTTYEFASSNVLWRATLKSLEFLPLLNADYSGGIIITDWYSDETNSQEQIKLTIRFLNNEVRSDSIEIIAHKKICSQNNNNCKIIKLDNNFSQKIKESIMTSARVIKIEEEKKKN